MPLYEYACDGCAQKVTLLQSMSIQQEEAVCPHCGEKRLKRLFSTFASKNGDAPAPTGTGHSHGGGCGC
jgi:putative FmdB family regulatory protein